MGNRNALFSSSSHLHSSWVSALICCDCWSFCAKPGEGSCPYIVSLVRGCLAGHLSGAVPESAERVLLLAFLGTSLIFAGRKWTQPIKDDIGDKSVFT